MARVENLTPWEESVLAQFFAASETFRSATIPYLAVAAIQDDVENKIISARVIFASPTALVAERKFQSAALRVFIRPLPDVKTAEEIVRSAALGVFDFAEERYRLWDIADGHGGIVVEPFNETMGPQMRLCSLTVRGKPITTLFDPQYLDWALRAADPPYLSLAELLSEYSLPPLGTHTTFEAYHTTPVAIDQNCSVLSGTELTVGIRLERGLSTSEARLGLIAVKAGEQPVRRTFSASELSWQLDGEIQLGTLRWSVPAGRAVQAIAIFRDTAFHYWWIVDPLQIPNTRKAVYEIVDKDLALLRDFMVASGPKGSARDLESAVAWILWMLGFAVAHLGSNTRTQDAVDILAATPSGNFALVECTTGVISTDKKVANLLSRRAVVLERLARASHNTVRVLPVIVTSRGRDEVLQEIKPAQERGVFVITRDELVDLLNRTDLLPDADELYNNAESQLAAATAGEPNLPGLS